MHMQSWLGAVSAVLAGAIFALLHIYFCAMVGIVFKNRGHLETSEFKLRYGECLTQGLSLDGSVCGTYWNIIQLARWAITNLILVILRDYCPLQLISLYAISLTF